MEETYRAYLTLLEDLTGNLDRLTGLAQQKSSAVRKDDLLALNEVLKQEQVISLSLRGVEQKRSKLLQQLELTDVPLSQLASRFPASLRIQAGKTAENLQRSYKIYHAAAEGARTILECNLHQIEKVISDMGGSPAEGIGRPSLETDPPKNMKTDFRA